MSTIFFSDKSRFITNFAPENQAVAKRFFNVAAYSTESLENTIRETKDIFNEKIGALLNGKDFQCAVTDMKTVLLKEKGSPDSYMGMVSSFVENLEKTKAELEHVKRLETLKFRWFTASIVFVAIGALPGLSLLGAIGLISLVAVGFFHFINMGNKTNSKIHLSSLDDSLWWLQKISFLPAFKDDNGSSKRNIGFFNSR